MSDTERAQQVHDRADAAGLSVVGERESIDAIFKARTVALVGASDREGSWGDMLLQLLLDSGYPGEIVPINPRLTSISGIPAFPSLSAVPKKIDLVILIVTPGAIVNVVEEAASCGIRTIVALTGGFAEEGGNGIDLEERIRSVVDAHAIRFIGPNSAGFSDTNSRMNVYPHVKVAPGKLAIISQGGGVGAYMCRVAQRREIGVSKILSLGNQLRTDLVDSLDWIAEDPDTTSVAVQIEGSPRVSGRHFMRRVIRSLENLNQAKGVSVFHTGRGAISAELAFSHTASLASPGSLFAGACRQRNIPFAATAADAVVMADWLGRKRLTGGSRIALVGSGSQCMYMADICENTGFSIPELGASIQGEISEVLRHKVPVRNPLDLVSGNLQALGSAVKILSQSPDIDRVIFGLPSIEQLSHISPEDREGLWNDLCEATVANPVKPIVGVEWFGAISDDVRGRLSGAGQLVVAEPEEAVRILWALR